MSKINFSSYDLVIFDLDNTLYDEKKYLFAAYEKIALYIAENNPNIKSSSILFYLKSEFKKNGRRDLFDKLKKKFKLKFSIKNCLSIMRTITLDDKLSLFKNSYHLLSLSISQTNTCIVTNGNPFQQKNKVNLINWKGLDKKIKFYYANEVEPKPSKKIFTDIIKIKYNIKKNKVLMIGDSQIDNDFSKAIGCDFVYINSIITENE